MDFVDGDDVLNFMSITGAGPETAQMYLQVSEGNVEAAISLYMENGGQELGATTESIARSEAATSTASRPRIVDEEVRAPIAPKHDVLIGGYDDEDWGREVVPPTRRARSRPDLRHTSSSAFASENVSSSSSSASSERMSRLQKMFEPPLDIMFPGDFDAARRVAKDKLKWILVTISEKTEFVCEALKRDLWNNRDVKEFIKERFIFAFFMADTSEGLKHINFYPVDSYPYFAIIDPRTVEEFLENNSLVNDTVRKKRPKPSQSKSVSEMSEDDMLRMALAASLSSNPSQEIIDVDDEMDTPEKIPEDPSMRVKANVRDEPTSGDITRIQFRLPDGSRNVRKFLKSDKILYLFEYVKGVYPDASTKPFELLNFRDALSARMEETIEAAKAANASISVEIKE
ncbi:hypothetical protein HDU97_006942 [Phlyctochytrium planicorne]|nr:hypothetical protein HDU97_006942 [Phlyctochytrium planicorne]